MKKASHLSRRDRTSAMSCSMCCATCSGKLALSRCFCDRAVSCSCTVQPKCKPWKIAPSCLRSHVSNMQRVCSSCYASGTQQLGCRRGLTTHIHTLTKVNMCRAASGQGPMLYLICTCLDAILLVNMRQVCSTCLHTLKLSLDLLLML